VLCEGSEWLWDRPHPGLWYLAQITVIRNLAPQRIDEDVGSQEHLVLQLLPRRRPAEAFGNKTDISANASAAVCTNPDRTRCVASQSLARSS
jgi:hypothetical protein